VVESAVVVLVICVMIRASTCDLAGTLQPSPATARPGGG
jgi:hypothetical protein